MCPRSSNLLYKMGNYMSTKMLYFYKYVQEGHPNTFVEFLYGNGHDFFDTQYKRNKYHNK